MFLSAAYYLSSASCSKYKIWTEIEQYATGTLKISYLQNPNCYMNIKIFRLSIALLSTVIFLNACRKSITPPPTGGGVGLPVIAPPPPFGFYVIGYFPSYHDPASVPSLVVGYSQSISTPCNWYCLTTFIN